MRYPLDNWHNLPCGYTFGVPTFYSDFHLGLDVIVPVGTKLLAPEAGTVEQKSGTESGWTVYLHGKSGVLWRFMHNSKFASSGAVQQGQLLALTGGKPGAPGAGLSKSPHTHIDISKNGKLELGNRANFIDPDLFLNQHVTMDSPYSNMVIRCQDGPQAGSFAYVKGDKKQIITRDNAGLSVLTFIQRSVVEKPLKQQIVNVPQDVFNALPTVPQGTWF